MEIIDYILIDALGSLTITYNTTNIDPMSIVAQLCSMAKVRPLSVILRENNVSIEFSNRDDAVRYTEEYLGSEEGVSEFVV